MSDSAATDRPVEDSVPRTWVESMPASLRPFLRLSRYDRPAGFWLLALPGWAAIGLASIRFGVDLKADAILAALILIGAIAMRGAGCTYNDIVDADLDAQVQRTAQRPIPAGTVSRRGAWVWLGVQCLAGLLVLLALPRNAQIIALVSIGLVAAYPFMKRITNWPQAWLGITFNWAAPVAYAAKTGQIDSLLVMLFLGLVVWTLFYDTIYARQDVEDDALIGVKSTALLFGDSVKGALLIMALVCLAFMFGLDFAARQGFYSFSILGFAAHLAWQMSRFDKDNRAGCLALFKSNVWAGLLLAAGLYGQGLYNAFLTGS